MSDQETEVFGQTISWYFDNHSPVKIGNLDATTEEFTLKKDRSFTFVIDKLDTDETVQNLQAASALERQVVLTLYTFTVWAPVQSKS